MKIIDKVALTFDDVLLEPKCSTISSRFGGEVNLSTALFPGIYDWKLEYPIISANMDTVTERDMAVAMEDLGGIGIVHRFMPIQEQIAHMDATNGYAIGCIGIGDEARRRLEALDDWMIDAVLIDVAHGHSKDMCEQVRWVKENYGLPVIAGNIATREAACDLIGAGVDCVKVGVGPGSLCTTRIKTGCGVPQLQAIIEVAEIIREVNQPVTLIADGGIRSSGDIVKALAAGADAVMVGSLFAGTSEAPGRCYRDEQGHLYKIYRGMASREAQEDWKGYASSVEGEMRRVSFRGSVRDIFKELIDGILSGMSYQNAHNLQELRDNAVFIQQTLNGYKESTPHGL